MNVPQSGEGWRAMDEDELFDIALSGNSGVAGHEISRRLIVALREFKQAADKSSGRLLVATWVLIVLTAAILLLTGVLVLFL